MLKVNLDERCAYRCRGGVKAGAGKMLGGKCGGSSRFLQTERPMGPSAVLRCCLGVKSVEALQSCPGVTAGGYSFTQAPGMSRGCGARRWRAGLLPKGQISRRDKAESKQKNRQIGRCCGGQTQCVVLGS